jgi:hypothetical protein
MSAGRIKRRCRSCRFFDRSACHRRAPLPVDYRLTEVLCWLMKFDDRDDPELAEMSPQEIRENYVWVGHGFSPHWPQIEDPDEDWCGEWEGGDNHREQGGAEPDPRPLRDPVGPGSTR